MGVSLDASAWTPYAHQTMSFLAMDPPRQTRLRKLVSKGFTPKRVAELEPSIQRITDLYLDEAMEAGEFDWIGDFAGKLPMDVISEMLGVPEADRDEVRRLADLLVHREPGLRDVPPVGIEAAMTLFGYYADLLAERKRQPADDLTSALLAAEDDGDRMTDQEIIAFLFLMVVAGNETTTKLLGNAMYHLTDHPDQRDEVFGDGERSRRPLDRGDPAPRHLDPAARAPPRRRPDPARRHRAEGLEAAASASARPTATTGCSPTPTPSTCTATRPSCGRASASAAVDTSASAPTSPGSSRASRCATLVRRARSIEADHAGAVRFYSANVRGFAHLPVRVVAR